MRGKNAVSLLSHACLETLNRPKNAAKGDWKEMSWRQIADKLTEEYNELMAELWAAERGDVSGVLAEAADVANCAAFALDKAITELIQGR